MIGGIDMRAQCLSLIYRICRRLIIKWLRWYRYCRGEVPDLEDAIVFGEIQLKRLDRVLAWPLFYFSIPKGLEVTIESLQFPSPVIFASFQGDLRIIGTWLKMGVGGGTLKTIMAEPREGNPRPRIQEIRIEGAPTYINALGLPGKGIDGFLKELDDSKIWAFKRPIGISIGGESIQEYGANLEAVEQVMNQTRRESIYYEINISCPNTNEGQNLIKNPHLIESLVTLLRDQTEKMISIKISPDQSNTDILKIGALLKSFPKMMMTIGNTRYQSCEEVGIPGHYLSRGGGGLSGPPLYKRTLELVTLLAPLKIPLIAIGGVKTAAQVQELRANGARLVGLATALIQDPYCVPRINHTLTGSIKRY